ncbi:MAG: RsiV family protein [Prevotella sp.]|jgi:hypothetical protein
MNIKTFARFVALALVIVLSACGGKQQATPDATSIKCIMDEEMDESVDSLVVDRMVQEQKDSIIEVSYQVDYPVAGKLVLVDSLRRFITQAIDVNPQKYSDFKEALKSVVRQQYASLNEERTEFDAEVDFEVPSFAYECRVELEEQNDSYVTFSTAIYEYHGGAHGGAFGACTTFRKDNGQQLGWNMLQDPHSAGFLNLIKKGLYAYFSSADETITNDSQLQDCLLIVGDVSHLPLPSCQPWLTKEGMVLSYQQYEIAPYAAGMPSFVLTYQEVRPYLTKEALQLLHL